MADKMVVEDKQLAASLLPAPAVTMKKKTNKKAPLLPAVQLVCLWALLTVAVLLGSFAFAATLGHYHIHTPSWFPAGAEPTDAEDAEVCAINKWMPRCLAAAAATAVLALLLPAHRRRSRWVLACVALAATATIHLMFARIITLVFATDLGNIFWWILVTVEMSFVAAGDIICFLALLGRGGYANIPAA